MVWPSAKCVPSKLVLHIGPEEGVDVETGPPPHDVGAEDRVELLVRLPRELDLAARLVLVPVVPARQAVLGLFAAPAPAPPSRVRAKKIEFGAGSERKSAF